MGTPIGAEGLSCDAEQECHFGAGYNTAVNSTLVDGMHTPATVALARFTSIPHGCAKHFEAAVKARDKLNAPLDGPAKSRCDSRMFFREPDIVIAYTVIVLQAFLVVIAYDSRDIKSTELNTQQPTLHHVQHSFKSYTGTNFL